MVFRKPLAQTRGEIVLSGFWASMGCDGFDGFVAAEPSRFSRKSVACSELLSRQALQSLPTLTYKKPSGPTAMVRYACCPPSGRSLRSVVSPLSEPSAATDAVTTLFVDAK